MTVNLNDVIRLTAVLKWSTTDDILNVVHVQNLTAAPIADSLFMNDAAQYLDNAYAFLVSRQAPLLNYVNVKGQNITQSLLLPTTNWPAQVNGSSVNQSLPLTTTPMIYFPTVVPKRIGKIFLPPFTEDTQDAGILDAASITQLQNFAGALNTTFVGANAQFRFIVWSRKFLGFSVPSTSVVPGELRTQRRRRRGVGS